MLMSLCLQALRRMTVREWHGSGEALIVAFAACAGMVTVSVGAVWLRDRESVGGSGHRIRRRGGKLTVALNVPKTALDRSHKTECLDDVKDGEQRFTGTGVDGGAHAAGPKTLKRDEIL